jgi:hypothetical protein
MQRNHLGRNCMEKHQPFMFYTERRLVLLTGIKAKRLSELLSALRKVPGSSIFYHTHQQFLSHHFETPLFYNDFALWISQALQEEALAEKMAAIDLLAFTSIRQLREAIIHKTQEFLRSNGDRDRECPRGDEFHFCRSKSFVMPTGLVARNVPEFFGLLPLITNISLFFHFFEARLRLGRLTNDFSAWLRGLGEEELAMKIDQFDPYLMSLDELKNEIMKLGEKFEKS